MSEEEILCSFCGRTKSQTKLLIAGLDAHICDICISQADMIVKDDETSKESTDFSVDLKPPIEIKNFLDLHVIGQEQAKKTLAVATAKVFFACSCPITCKSKKFLISIGGFRSTEKSVDSLLVSSSLTIISACEIHISQI